MNDNEALIEKFYAAFSRKDYRTMQAAYHPDASFSDPVFQDLSSAEVKAMWEMLIASSTDFQVTFSNLKADNQVGECHWEAAGMEPISIGQSEKESAGAVKTIYAPGGLGPWSSEYTCADNSRFYISTPSAMYA